MSIRELEDRLFAEWKLTRKGLVEDGAVDEEAYLNSSPKLLFVLKEANDQRDGGGWDLRQFLREDDKPHTWNNIARWVEGIRHLRADLRADLEWKVLSEIDKNRKRQMLRSIVAINLKKSPGGHTTDTEALAKVAAEDKSFLNKQFTIYEPDLIICCGTDTSNIFHELVNLGLGAKPKWRLTRRGIWFHEFKPKQYVIAFSHPEARVAENLLYYGIVDAIREIFYAPT